MISTIFMSRKSSGIARRAALDVILRASHWRRTDEIESYLTESIRSSFVVALSELLLCNVAAERINIQ